MHNKNKKKGGGQPPREESTGKAYEQLVDSLYMNEDTAHQPEPDEPTEDEDEK